MSKRLDFIDIKNLTYSAYNSCVYINNKKKIKNKSSAQFMTKIKNKNTIQNKTNYKRRYYMIS